MGLNKMREEIANTFIAALEENTIPWHRPWNLMNRPANFISGTEYNGLNRFWLAYIADEMKYDDNRWCTFKQASEKGYHIKKGEHGTPVEFWSWYDTQEKKKLNYPEYVKLAKELHDSGENWQERIKPISSIYLVFNASQMEGVPPIDKDSLAVNDNLLECRDKLLEAMELEFIEGGDRAFYLPSNDSLHMPLYENFKSEYGYMATFLHECGHATGAEHRLNRNIRNSFGTENYAKEELRAEIASAFTAQALGIGQGEKLDNHAAYIQSWIKTLKDNPNELFAAIKDAEKISDYLIEKGEFLKEKEAELVKETDKSKNELIASIGNYAMDEDGYLSFTIEADGYELEGLFRFYDEEEPEHTMELVSIDYGYHHPIIKEHWKAIEKALIDYVNKKYPEQEVTITCEWSESNHFEDGKTYSVYEFDNLMRNANALHIDGEAKAIAHYGSKEEWYNSNVRDEFTQFIGYDKTKFTINFPNGHKVTERQDIGDIGDSTGGVIDYFNGFNTSKYRQIALALNIQYKRDEEKNNKAIMIQKENKPKKKSVKKKNKDREMELSL